MNYRYQGDVIMFWDKVSPLYDVFENIYLSRRRGAVALKNSVTVFFYKKTETAYSLYI